MIGPVVITREEAEMFKQVYPKDFSLKADGSHIMKMWRMWKKLAATTPSRCITASLLIRREHGKGT